MSGIKIHRLGIILLFFTTVNCYQNFTRIKRIVGGIAAAIPPEDDPVVYVNRGKRYAEIYGERDADGDFYIFKGIRYGMPPFGKNRFQRPKEMPLQGELRALRWGPPCPQLNEEGDLIGHEDCLFLNVFAPTLPDLENRKYPVLIWIHGGGFRRGSANQYGMRYLIKKKLIVVSIQYRLGTLGFISSGTSELPGNNGIFDMMLAVRWVKKYIEFFGGDNSRITVFGHEVGASAAMLLGLSKLTNSDLSGLITMSGSSLSNFALDKEPANTAKLIAAANDCPTNNTIEMVNCLKEVPVEKLVSVDSQIDNQVKVEGFVSTVTTIVGARPVVEGLDDSRFLPNFTPNSPTKSLSLGDIPNIPLLTGVTSNEIQGAVLGDHKQEISRKIAEDPNYFRHRMIPKLQKNVPKFNITKYFSPDAFNKYLKIYDNSKQSLESVTSAVGDALINVPAYLTAKYWSRKARSIVYSFDHNGKRKTGSKFLAGSPIVSRNPPPEAVNYGDDLGYLFNLHSLTGERMVEEKMDEDDEAVSETFTDMVAQFARSGNYHMNGESKEDSDSFFSDDNNNYISIKKKPQMMKNFRYCEIGLWMGLAERLQSPICSLLKTTVQTVNQVVEAPTNILKTVDSGLPTGFPTPPSGVGRNLPGSGFLSRGKSNYYNDQSNPTDAFKQLQNSGRYYLQPVG